MMLADTSTDSPSQVMVRVVPSSSMTTSFAPLAAGDGEDVAVLDPRATRDDPIVQQLHSWNEAEDGAACVGVSIVHDYLL